jgi:SecD/SecF fusion protein
MGLFDERIAYKPFDYPEYYTEGWLKQAQAFWLHTEIPMQSDIKDWKEKLDEKDAAADLFAEIENGADSASSDSSSSLLAQQNAEQYAKDHPLFSVMRPAIFQNPQNQQYEFGQGPVVGYVAIKDTALVNKYLAMKEVQSFFPPKSKLKFLWTAKPYDDKGEILQLIAIKVDNRDLKAALEGDVVVDASQQFDQFSGSPEISMTMNGEGANKWRILTGGHIGESIAIALDDLVYSFPTVNGEISGG